MGGLTDLDDADAGQDPGEEAKGERRERGKADDGSRRR